MERNTSRGGTASYTKAVFTTREKEWESKPATGTGTNASSWSTRNYDLNSAYQGFAGTL